MRGDTSSPQIDRSNDAWVEIEALVDETARLARMPMSSHEFHTELVRRLVQATDAQSAAIWCPGNTVGGEAFSIEAHIDASGKADVGANLLAARLANVIEVARGGQATCLLPGQSLARIHNPFDRVVVLQPSRIDEQTVSVIETTHREASSPHEIKNAEALVAIFCDLVADFRRNCDLRELRNRETSWTSCEQFVEQVHHSLDLKRTAYTVANEAILVASCDRVSVFQIQGSRCRTLAISGLASFDRRSTQIRAAEQLATGVAAVGEQLWHSTEPQTLPPQLDKLLAAHLDCSHARSIAVVPISAMSDGDVTTNVGVVLFERFESTPWTDAQRRRIEFVCRHSATALHNALELGGLPFVGFNRALKRCLAPFTARHISKTIAALCLLIIGIAALVLLPTDFEIQAEGQLMPTDYRHVFAPADGVIDQLHVRHAQTVAKETPLLDMRRTDLDYDEASLLGDVLTNQKRLDAVKSALLNHKPGSATSAGEFHELTSEEARLEIQLNSLREQQAILDKERAELAITSPIGGEVLTWGLEDELTLRPVRRGERLMSVANSNGPWQLDLRIADRDIEHVLAARDEQGSLGVSFILTSHAGEQFTGTVREIAVATELNEHGQATVLVRVDVDRDELETLRPGAGVVANLHCGRRSIGYVWFRELFDVIQTKLLF